MVASSNNRIGPSAGILPNLSQTLVFFLNARKGKKEGKKKSALYKETESSYNRAF